MNHRHTYVAIMAGGIGSRFWPASRTGRPKQFLDILGVGKSLIRLTFERFLKLTTADRIYVVTNGQYRDLVKEHLPEISDNQILCEPSRNNTAPCVAYTSFKLHQIDPEANFVVAPSDHIILDEAAFVGYLEKALAFTAREDALVTLGIQPTRPDTGYGYIKFEQEQIDGVHRVRQFTEKPQLDKARAFVAGGDYLWNAGIFVWRASSILDAFHRHAREIYDILAPGRDEYNTAGEQAFVDAHYPLTPSISIDYAIMEKAANVYTIPSSFGWSDLGTWASLHAESEKDAHGNVINGNPVLAFDTADCLVRTPAGKLVVLKDLHDFIVVDEGDVLLIFPKSKEQEIKQVTQQIERELGDRFL